MSENIADEGIPPGESMADFPGGSNQQVAWEGAGLQKEGELGGPFGRLLSGPPDDKQVHLAVGLGMSSGLGAEKDDFLRMHLGRDSASHLPDGLFRGAFLSYDSIAAQGREDQQGAFNCSI